MRYFIFVSMLVLSLAASAQNKMTITYKDGTKESIRVAKIEKITWDYVNWDEIPYIYYSGDVNGWSTTSSPLARTDNGYVGYYYVKYADNENTWGFKFVADTWYGGHDGTIDEDDNNMSPEHDGFYQIRVNMIDMTYSLTEITKMSIIGSDSNWSTDHDLRFNTYTMAWEGRFTLPDGEYKIRANHDWTLNWGGSEDAMTENSTNLSIAAGTYKFSFKPDCDGKGTLVVTPAEEHEAVDLGLSVKWATCNIGATNPEDDGDYFAWGETTGYYGGKTTFDWSTYTLCDGTEDNMTKYYYGSSSYGTLDVKTVLEADDDAATVNWEGSWRMPDRDELTELCVSCYWEWTSDYNNTGKAGYIVYKAKYEDDEGVMKYSDGTYNDTLTGSYSLNDTHIFLPAAGYYAESSSLGSNTYGIYWSSSVYKTSSKAYILYFNVNDTDVYYSNSTAIRCLGINVRPVCK